MLMKDYVRDGNGNIIASVTTGFSDTSAIVRDEGNRISGRTNERFHTSAMYAPTWSPSTPLTRVS
jgi:hypothetical protein